MTVVKNDGLPWSIRFYIHRTTVCLFVNPTSTLKEVKFQLSEALRESYPRGIQGKPLPDDPSKFIFAKIIFGTHVELERIGIEFGSDTEEAAQAGIKDDDAIAVQWDLDGPINIVSWDLSLPTVPLEQ